MQLFPTVLHSDQDWLLLDGATGTQLQKAGMPAGVNPERWVLDHPNTLISIQRQYLEAGSNILYTFTFGANRTKLSRSLSSEESVADINCALAALSVNLKKSWMKDHPGDVVLIAGDLAPTGQFLEPAGTLSFDALVDIYREQVQGLLRAGVDLFVVETMMDLAQTRAAVLAVQAECDYPVIASMTLENNGRTLSGQKPDECLLTLSSLGVAAFGLNCSAGPEQLSDWILPLKTWSPIPLLIKPNAGLPQLINGQTVFPMTADAFSVAMQPVVAAGLALFGGCCGTEPEHISKLYALLKSQRMVNSGKIEPAQNRSHWICSSRQSVNPDEENEYVVVSAHIESMLDDCLDEMDSSASAIILDFTQADPEESEDYCRILEEIQLMVPLPMIFRCHNTTLLSALLKHYHGRAGVQTELKTLPLDAQFVSN